jgi:hypothetical protein
MWALVSAPIWVVAFSFAVLGIVGVGTTLNQASRDECPASKALAYFIATVLFLLLASAFGALALWIGSL